MWPRIVIYHRKSQKFTKYQGCVVDITLSWDRKRMPHEAHHTRSWLKPSWFLSFDVPAIGSWYTGLNQKMQHVPLISEDRAAPCACIHCIYLHLMQQIPEILKSMRFFGTDHGCHRLHELKPAESEHALRNLPWKWQKPFKISNTFRHLKGNQKSLQSHPVTMFKNSSSSLDTQTIPLKPLPCQVNSPPGHLCHVCSKSTASPRQRKESLHRNAFFLGISLYTHASNFYVGTWRSNNNFGTKLKLKAGAR